MVKKSVMKVEVDKIGSVTSPLNLAKTVNVIDENNAPRPGDLAAIRLIRF